MITSRTTKKYIKLFSVVLLILVIFLSNFPGNVFDDLASRLRDRGVVDNLYLARRDGKVIDNFLPIARASPGTRVRTVEFFAGQDAGSATNDNQNQQQNFATSTYQLAESSAGVIDAYVEVSVQVGATTATTYASSYIYFDSCTSPCTPSPAAFTTTAGLGTNSGEGQTIRFRASVTSESDIAAYTGGGTNKIFQVGYCFSTGATCSGTTAANIQGANAKLVMTYTYDDTSATQTNTVVYPLESASEVGSKTAAQAACTIDSNCPTFSYNAEIPEISSQLSQWFYLQSSLNTNGTTDWQSASDIGAGANTPAVYFDAALQNNGGWVNWLVSGVAGYANNATTTTFEVSTNASNAYTLGGENYITYTYANSAGTKTKTAVFPVGEVCVSAAACASKSALTGSTVYFPETGVTVKKAWFRIHTSAGGVTTAGTLAITTKVGNNSETGATSYSFAMDTQGVSDDGYFNHLIPSADYAELQSATASSGKAVQMTAQWTAAAGGAVSAELVITYTYTGDSSGYLVTQNLFAGQQTAAPATTYTTATGAINPALPETTGTKTIRGASIWMSAKDTSSTANGTVGANLSTGSCSSSNTSTPLTDNEITRVMLWKDVTSVVTNSDSQTYTACYSGGQASVFTGILVITYQWDAPAQATVSCETNVSSTSFGSINSSSVFTASPNASTTMSCSSTSSGCTLYVKDAGNGSSPGLYKSASPTYLIASADATLSAGADGYGVQATSTAGGLTLNSKYNKSGNAVGGLLLSSTALASSTADIASSTVSMTHKAAASAGTLSGSYSDTITYSCVVN